MTREEMLALLADMAALTALAADAPTLADMPRRTLADKRIDGPTSAHVIEEVHTPLNLAYLTFTTGSSSFQNIVGITHAELPERMAAGELALSAAGARQGEEMLVCYPPLINVFTPQALAKLGVQPRFLPRSSRDAFLVELCQRQLRLVVGESSFLRAALQEALRLGIRSLLPREMVLVACGTPLDPALPELAQSLGATLHDLYGCQEFGWLTLDGVPLREDICLLPEAQQQDWQQLVVGGLPTGDSFPRLASGHMLNPAGPVITYARRRSQPEYELIIHACTAHSAVTAARTARSILRIKGRVVRVAPNVQTAALENVLELRPAWPDEGVGLILRGERQTRLFQRMLEAQQQYQSQAKNDPLWLKQE